MEEIDNDNGIDVDNEIRRIEAMYKHYKLLYRKIAFLCCSGETKRVRNLRNSLKRNFKKNPTNQTNPTNENYLSKLPK